MSLIAPMDAVFLGSETREHPMHVGGLHVFRLPEGAHADYVQTLYQRLLDCTELSPMYRRKPAWPGPLAGSVRWADDDDVDLEYHVRLSALPRPGRVRELLALVSRLHGTLLDRHRPLWEFHLIEGLQENRFAVYIKVHHALSDGVNGVRSTMRMLSTEPTTDLRPFWAPHSSRPAPQPDSLSLRRVGELARDVVGVGPKISDVAVKSVRNRDAALPFTAPRTVLNRPLTGARRFARWADSSAASDGLWSDSRFVADQRCRFRSVAVRSGRDRRSQHETAHRCITPSATARSYTLAREACDLPRQSEPMRNEPDGPPRCRHQNERQADQGTDDLRGNEWEHPPAICAAACAATERPPSPE